MCGAPGVVREGVALLRPGGLYLLVGLVHPDSIVEISAETIIRKCLTIKGLLPSCFIFEKSEKSLERIRKAEASLSHPTRVWGKGTLGSGHLP